VAIDKEIAMRKSLAVFAVCAAGSLLFSWAAAAGPLGPSGFDQPPLLLIHWATDTIAGQHIESSAVIHAGGATEMTETKEGAPAQIVRGVASVSNFKALQNALLTGKVDIERGGCGSSTADGPIAYEVTWYGQTTRFNTFKVGADLGGCSVGLRSMIETILKVINDVRPAPGTQTFPRPRTK
jgi:hypothetical protein